MRIKIVFVAALALILGLALGSQASAHEVSGYVAVRGRFFPHPPLDPEQESKDGSIAAQLEYYHEWENGSSFTFVPFARLDSADSERTHFDIRELNYLHLADAWELRVGIGKVFWGTTEFVHLVDIINQTDGVESADGEEKLGQPMVHLSIPEIGVFWTCSYCLISGRELFLAATAARALQRLWIPTTPGMKAVTKRITQIWQQGTATP
jgi:hypothetical protein